jgi:hypothetical protein
MDGHFNTLGPVLSVAFDVVKTVLKSALDILAGGIRAFTGLITGDWTKFGEGIQRFGKPYGTPSSAS